RRPEVLLFFRESSTAKDPQSHGREETRRSRANVGEHLLVIRRGWASVDVEARPHALRLQRPRECDSNGLRSRQRGKPLLKLRREAPEIPVVWVLLRRN